MKKKLVSNTGFKLLNMFHNLFSCTVVIWTVILALIKLIQYPILFNNDVYNLKC